MATISRGQTAPAGFMITAGGVSGVCQADVCTIEPTQPATPVADTAATASPVAPQAAQLATPPRNPLMRQPVQGDVCTPQPDGSCRPAAQNVAASAAPVIMPTMNPGFTAQSGGDPYDVWRAQSLLSMANRARGAKGERYTDPSRATATAALGSSTDYANQLMAQGIDYDTAVASAQRRALDNSGYRAAGYMSGATPAANTLIGRAAQREAEQQYIRGGAMSPSGAALFPEAPGTVVTDAAGNIWQVSADGMSQLPVSAGAAQSAITVPMLIGGQIYDVYAEQNKRNADIAKALATNEAKAATEMQKQMLRNSGMLAQQRMRDEAAAERQRRKDASKNPPATSMLLD